MRILSNQLLGQGLRFFHVGLPHSCQGSMRGSSSPINKTLLAKLRKRTGYTFSNCKKALELHSYDLEKAERWLSEQAQALGWSKATKLEGRATAQGLIGVVVNSQNAAIIEINCETDFVARNKTFETMVDAAAKACIQFAKTQAMTSPFTKLHLDSERLRALPGDGGKPLSDQLALVIGTVGENLSLRRAICIRAGSGVKLAGYAHPSDPSANSKAILKGKYGALVAFRETCPATDRSEHLGRELCQHVVGMNPSKVGVEGEDVPAINADDERCLIYQEYLLDPTQTVAQLVATNGLEVVEFTRFECGESIEERSETPIDLAIEQGG